MKLVANPRGIQASKDLLPSLPWLNVVPARILNVRSIWNRILVSVDTSEPNRHN